MSPMALSRVTITLPAALLKEADRRAAALDRSRSWVVAEALRGYLSAPPRTVGKARAATIVREPAIARYPSAPDPQRLSQLEADLALTPEARVREAERTARDSETAGTALGARPPRVRAILSFDRYEDFLDWRRVQDLTP